MTEAEFDLKLDALITLALEHNVPWRIVRRLDHAVNELVHVQEDNDNT